MEDDKTSWSNVVIGPWDTKPTKGGKTRDALIEEETCHEVYDLDEHKAFEKAYADGRSFYDAQGQLELNDGNPAWNEAHLFALNYAREETGLGLAELADIGC